MLHVASSLPQQKELVGAAAHLYQFASMNVASVSLPVNT